MHCRNVQARLSEYLDSFLSPRHRQELEDHLRQCDACRQASREMRRLRDILGGLTPVDPPESLASRIDRIPWETSQDRPLIGPQTARIGLAVLTATAAVMVVLLRPTLSGAPAPGIPAVAQEHTGSAVVEVQQLMLPEERQGSPDPQWARVSMTRGVPLEGPRGSAASTPRQDRDELIWQEVRRVSACSRRSF
ncbi:MAG: zf-HC2 domain-containing protein [Candidatus Eisenbacteria bacterium]|nr:zf-HC2 domain-containing protein [Candidatus Eisenbacteria bacterium]